MLLDHIFNFRIYTQKAIAFSITCPLLHLFCGIKNIRNFKLEGKYLLFAFISNNIGDIIHVSIKIKSEPLKIT